MRKVKILKGLGKGLIGEVIAERGGKLFVRAVDAPTGGLFDPSEVEEVKEEK